jgi:hypothetical protein
VDLLQVHYGSSTGAYLSRRDAYDRALALHEIGDCAGACRILHSLLRGGTERDCPTDLLIARASHALNSPPDRFDGVFDLAGK